MKVVSFILSLFLVLVLGGCSDDNLDPNDPSNPSNLRITSFILARSDNPGLTADVTGLITENTITLTVPFNTDINALKPTVAYVGTELEPGTGIIQNFITPVIYTVSNSDGSYKRYTVVVKPNNPRTVYAGSKDGKLYALDGETGTLLWQYATSGEIFLSNPTYHNGTVFVGSSDDYLYAINASDGSLKWKYLTRGDVGYTSPVIFNNNVYIGGVAQQANGCIYAFNAETGSLIFEKLIPQAPTDIVVQDGVIYAGFASGSFSYNAYTGALLNQFQGNIAYGSLMVHGGKLFNGHETAIVAVYNINTGALIWRYVDPAGTLGTNASRWCPTYGYGNIYNAAYTMNLYALDSISGSLKWKYENTVFSGNKYFSSPTCANGMVYAGNGDGNFYAIDAITGVLRWKYNYGSTSQSIESNGTVAGNIVYFGNIAGDIIAVDAFSGTFLWKYRTLGSTYAGPCVVGSNGDVFHSGQSGAHQ